MSSTTGSISNIRISFCPCCGSAGLNCVWNNNKLRPTKDWKTFFYGGYRAISDIYTCSNCGYKFINNLTPNWAQYYAEQEIESYLSISTYRNKYFDEIKNQIRPFINKQPQTMLDIGCGDGGWLSVWPECEKRFGSEYSSEFRKVLHSHGINVVEDDDIKNREYDLISLFDVLEHIEEPRQFLDSIWRQVSTNGALIVAVPAMDKWIAKLLGHRYYLYCPMHFSYFGRRSLSTLLGSVCTGGTIRIIPSPPMKADLAAVFKWLGIKRSIPRIFNCPLPIGYSASLVAIVSK